MIPMTIVVGDELAGVHDLLGPLADSVSGRDRGAQHVAGRELRDAVLLDQPLCLRPLARPRRPEQNQPHRAFAPRSFDFLTSPSYWWARRWPWICATVSSVTLTTISSEVPPR